MCSPTVYHRPALLDDAIAGLAIKPDGIYVDVTFGGGGHSRAILARLGHNGRLLAMDRDLDAAANCSTMLNHNSADNTARQTPDTRFRFIHGNFAFLTNFLRYYNAPQVDGILADLGVSFHHFDDASRGFTFRADAPLDMRMTRRSRLTAADILNTYDEQRLCTLLAEYGELRQAKRLAHAIVAARNNEPLQTTAQLIDVADPLLRPQQRKKELAQLFQALRIEVNDELGALRRLLEASVQALRTDGRLAVITYHSLEDRLVKNFMRSGRFDGQIQQDFFGRTSSPLTPVGRSVTPSDAEVQHNPRARSARLRVAQKN